MDMETKVKIIGSIGAAMVVVIKEKYRSFKDSKKNKAKSETSSFWTVDSIALAFVVVLILGIYLYGMTKVMTPVLMTIQLIGFFASAYQVYMFQENDLVKMLYIQAIASGFFMVHFFFLGIAQSKPLLFTSASMNLINVVRSLVLAKKCKACTEADYNKLLAIFVVSFWVAALLNYQYLCRSWICFVAPFSVSVSTYAFIRGLIEDKIYKKENATEKFRIIYLPTSILWFGVNSYTKSHAGMFADSISFFSNIIGYCRYRRVKN